MNIPRAVVIGVGGGALVAWLASAGPSGTRPIEPLRPSRADAIDMKGEELAAEIARLHSRLHPTSAPEQPERNLFDFGSHAVHTAPAAPVATEPAPAPAPIVPPPPPIRLVGMAEDGGVRTAIISGSGQLFFVKEGERLADRYDVARIDSDGVDLVDTTDSRAVRLTLK